MVGIVFQKVWQIRLGFEGGISDKGRIKQIKTVCREFIYRGDHSEKFNQTEDTAGGSLRG